MQTQNSGFESKTHNEVNELFSLYKRPITNVYNPKSTSLADTHELITSRIYEENTIKIKELHAAGKAGTRNKTYDIFKSNNFDYVTFNGKFNKRCDKGFIAASGLFIVDMDHLGYAKLLLILERLKNDRVISPQLIFISPSGDGLKIILRIDFSLIDLSLTSLIMGIYWEAVNAYFATHFADLITPNAKNEYIDGACKDLSRACFLCHDKTAYLNENETILGHDFITAYQPKQVDKSIGKPTLKLSTKRTVNPATSLSDLATRHLLPENNHTPELLAFISGALRIGTPIEQTAAYMAEVHISPDSSKSDIKNLAAMVEDVYKRYGTNTAGVQYLTPLSFGYEILYFKYSKDIKKFILSGLFWDEIRNILHQAGFAKRKIGNSYVFIQSNGCIIKEVSPELMKDHVTNYVDSIIASISFNYQDEKYQIPPAAIRETFLKNSNNIFNRIWLQHLKVHNEPVIKDTEKEMYFFFMNDIVTVSKEGIKVEKWSDKKDFCIWDTQIIQHDFKFIEDHRPSHFYQFLKNVTNHDESRYLTMVTGIGYLLHHYFRESEGQAVIFYDETITDTRTPQGGSGKGLIINAIKQIRNVTKVDGKHLAKDSRFIWELVTPSTQTVWIDDVKPDFDFSLLHTNLTDGWTIERKFLSQFVIEPKDSPKTVICSNSIIKGGGSTNKRRQFIIELSDYYSRQIVRGDEKPIEQTHGCIFFNKTIWLPYEWNLFFSLMLNCAYQYLNEGLIQNAGVNVELNRFKQTTDDDFAAWVIDQGFELNRQYETTAYFKKFVLMYYGDTHQIGQRKFTEWMAAYATFKGCRHSTKQSNGISYFLMS